MNDKFRNFHIIRSRAVPQKNIKDLQSKIIAELINVVILTTSAAIVVLIILVVHNAMLLAGWVLYLNDKFRKASD